MGLELKHFCKTIYFPPISYPLCVCARAPFERVGDKWEKVTFALESHLLSAYSTINRSRHVSIKTADSELRTSHARFATFIGIDIDSSLLSLLKLSLVNSNP